MGSLGVNAEREAAHRHEHGARHSLGGHGARQSLGGCAALGAVEDCLGACGSVLIVGSAALTEQARCNPSRLHLLQLQPSTQPAASSHAAFASAHFQTPQTADLTPLEQGTKTPAPCGGNRGDLWWKSVTGRVDRAKGRGGREGGCGEREELRVSWNWGRGGGVDDGSAEGLAEEIVEGIGRLRVSLLENHILQAQAHVRCEDERARAH